jgi:murein L,D-transpeptidase YafK
MHKRKFVSYINELGANSMKTTTILLVLVLTLNSFAPSDFLKDQKKNSRVKKAYADKGEIVKNTLKKSGISFDNFNVIFIAYKDEQVIDMYAKNKRDKKYIKIKSYNICAKSGQLGPKRRAGDRQVPEGFYHIDRFNPSSSYYLSLGVNYPNLADRKKSNTTNLGGDIFIHGHCVTIGCMPITDDKIKEIYICAIQARQGGQMKIPVYIFPFKLTNNNVQKYKERYKKYPDLSAFWNNLKVGHDKFLSDQKELDIKIDEKGNYKFN